MSISIKSEKVISRPSATASQTKYERTLARSVEKGRVSAAARVDESKKT
jgi:hypothetical protein